MPRWLLFSILALLFFGGWAVAPKALSPGLAESPFEAQALSTVGLLPILAVLGRSRKMREGSARRKGAAIAFLAGLLAVAGNIAYYKALGQGKAVVVAPLTALYPLVTVALALLFLREKPTLVQAGGIVLALLAIYAFNPFDWKVGAVDAGGPIGALTLLPILLYGVAGLLQKVSTAHASSELSSFWFQAAFLPAAAAILLARGDLSLGRSLKDWAVCGLIGLFFGLGNIALIVAYGSGGKASIVTPLTAVYSVVAIPVAVLFLGETAGGREATGMALALVSVAMLSYEGQKEAQGVGQAP